MDQDSVQEEIHFNILYMQRFTQVASWEGTYSLILSHYRDLNNVSNHKSNSLETLFHRMLSYE